MASVTYKIYIHAVSVDVIGPEKTPSKAVMIPITYDEAQVGAD